MSTGASRHHRRQASSEAEAISRITRHLQQQFPELPAEAVEAAVNGRHQDFNGRPIRDFIPILVEHAARDDLTGGHPSTA